MAWTTTAPKKRKSERVRKNLTNHKQICSVCVRVFMCKPHEQQQSSRPLRCLSKFCIWIWEQSFDALPTSPAFAYLLLQLSSSLSRSMSFSLSFFIAQTFEINQIVNTTKCSPKTCKHFVRSASCVRSIDEREFYYYFFHSENSQLLQGENIHVYIVVSSTYLQRFWLSIYAVFAFSGWKFVKFVAEVTWNFSVNSK